MNGRPHESPDCRCAPCTAYDYEQDALYSYGYAWSDESGGIYEYLRGSSAYEAERAAWEALVYMCDVVFADDVK